MSLFCCPVAYDTFIPLPHGDPHGLSWIRVLALELAHNTTCLLALSVMWTTAAGMKCAGCVSLNWITSAFFYQNPKVRSRTQTIQSTQSTFTPKRTVSVHINHIACFIYSFSLMTSSEPIRKVLEVSQTFKYTHVRRCVSY